MNYRYVFRFDFWDVKYTLDDCATIRVYINGWRLKGVDVPMPDAVAYLLRAQMDCVPVRGAELDSGRSSC